MLVRTEPKKGDLKLFFQRKIIFLIVSKQICEKLIFTNFIILNQIIYLSKIRLMKIEQGFFNWFPSTYALPFL